MHAIRVVKLVGSLGNAVEFSDVEAGGELILGLVDMRDGDNTGRVVELDC
jgi:hypothetical protein